MNKYILDTHVFIWYAIGDKRLSRKAIEFIDSPAEKLISIASIWEMAIKLSLGKLSFKQTFDEIIDSQIRLNSYTLLPITKEHTF